MLLRFVVFLMMFFVVSFALAEDGKTQSITPENERVINWWVNDVPPFIEVKSTNTFVAPSELHGPLAGLYKILAASLPQYEHRFVRVPAMRAMKLAQEKKQFCSLIILENKERRNYLTFGEEISVGLPVGIVTQRHTPAKLSYANVTTNEVDLTRTLAGSDFRLGFVTGRYYNDNVTPLIAKDKKSFGLVSDGSITKLMAMLEAKRLDGVLAVYLEMAEYERSHPEAPKMQFMRLKEIPEFTALRASCDKTAWGEKAIKAISKVVREKNFKEISNSYLLSVLPADRRKEYQKIYDSRPKPAMATGTAEPSPTKE
jgi:uncharacterized protein (TIGR02285 family)